MDKHTPNWSLIKSKITELNHTLHNELGWFNIEELKETPRRITNFYKEWSDNNDFDFTTFKTTGENGMVILKNIDFYSMCSHHMLPFFGKIHIAYLQRNDGELAGISKLPRTALKFASKPQQQENLSKEIVDYLYNSLHPWFVMVVIEANHLCMAMRGVKQRTSETITSEIRWDKEKFTLDQMEKIKEEAQLHLYR